MRTIRHQKGIASRHGYEKPGLPEALVGKGKAHPPCSIRGMSQQRPFPVKGIQVGARACWSGGSGKQ